MAKKNRIQIDYKPAKEQVLKNDERYCGTESCDFRVRFYPSYGWWHVDSKKADRDHNAIPGEFEYPNVVAVNG